MRSETRLRAVLAAGALLVTACGAAPAAVLPASVLTAESPPTVHYVLPSRATTTPPPTSSRTVRPPTSTRTITPTPPPSTVRTTSSPVPQPNAAGPLGYYSALDKLPVGSLTIAFPTILHGAAGGSGTYDDPLTLAAAAGTFAPGTRIYVPGVKRYFVLEDSCLLCHGLELWTGSAIDAGMLTCQTRLTRTGDQPYQIDPPAGLPVVAGNLYENGACYQP